MSRSVLSGSGLKGDPGPVGPSGPAGNSTASVTTTGVTSSGRFVYSNGAGTVAYADCFVPETANVVGAYQGTVGQIVLAGTIPNAQFTAQGGQPANGAVVYLACSNDDSSTGVGKLSATPPIDKSQAVVQVGFCVDNSNYASLKTCVVTFGPNSSMRATPSTTYYLDPGGVGNDANNGTANTSPIKTIKRLKQLIGGAVFVGKIPIYNNTTVLLMSDHTDTTDQFSPADFELYASLIVRPYGTGTVTQSGTITSLGTRNRTAGTSWTVTDSALAAGSWSSQRDHLIVDTTQTPNLVSWVSYDLNADGVAKTARTQEWFQSMDYTPIVPAVTHGTPVSGNSYQVIQLTKLVLGNMDTREGPVAAGVPRLTLYRLHCTTVYTETIDANGESALITAVECRFDSNLFVGNANNFQMYNCRFTQTTQFFCHQAFFYGCGFSLGATGITPIEPYELSAYGFIWLNDDCMFENCPLHLRGSGAQAKVEVGVSFFTTGVAIMIDAGSNLEILTGTIYGGYASQTPSIGIGIGVNSSVGYGGTAANSFALNTTVASFGLGAAYQGGGHSTGYAFNTSTNAIVGPIANTWANLDLAVGSGGFGGAAFDPRYGSRICQR